ncbi:hypothetical protein GRS96_13955 [Rathayibacter sp. VKM Ac-2803]|uniref:cell wall-binding repeat-containing protein n=1 Tax=Rathayibacter sp. VKM Ac-2803 TaxID=2609256 RepID=UPI00135A3149|nr:cell wall-binding repeat-containing protein [Rathayibacter sp. VKM Ac-2803]MWV50373.1 hypothetical protein [Rathayibacter sp. VKM Ac-2803]
MKTPHLLTAAITALVLVSGSIAVDASAEETTATLIVTADYVTADGSPAEGPAMTTFQLSPGDSDGVGWGGPGGASSGSVFGGTTSFSVQPGAWTVRASADGWAHSWLGGTPFAESAEVAVLAAGETRTFVVELHPGGTVSGVVGSNASVDAYLQDPATGDWESMSRDANAVVADGRYTLDSLPAGEYAVRAEREPDGEGRRFFSDRYWKDSPTLAGATTVRVDAGSTTTGIDLRLRPWQYFTDRVAGSDRYDTAVSVSRSAFTAPVPVLYLVSGANWPDALSAGPAAALQGGALLLTDPTILPDVVTAEIRRLAPERIVVVGSSLSVSTGVEERLRELSPVVDRIGGRDRYETSRLVVVDAFGDLEADTVFLATGTNFPDALSVGPVAGYAGDPVLLVDGAQSALDAPTEAALRARSPLGVQIIGSESAISAGIAADVESALPDIDVRRVSGGDRIRTSVAVNRGSNGDPLNDTAYLVRADSFADALGSIAAASELHRRIYLTDSDCIRQSVLDAAQQLGIDRFVLLGGTGTLSSAVAALSTCAP